MILRWGEAEILGNPEERTRDVRTGEEREEERRQLATISWRRIGLTLIWGELNLSVT